MSDPRDHYVGEGGAGTDDELPEDAVEQPEPRDETDPEEEPA